MNNSIRTINSETELLLRAPAAQDELRRLIIENDAIFRQLNWAIDRIFHPKQDLSATTDGEQQ